MGGRAAVINALAGAAGNESALASERTDVGCGRLVRPVSMSLTARGDRLACRASASWDIPAACRSLFSNSANAGWEGNDGSGVVASVNGTVFLMGAHHVGGLGTHYETYGSCAAVERNAAIQTSAEFQLMAISLVEYD